MTASWLKRLGFGRMAHNAIMNLLWQLARVASQALWLIAAARILGVHEYGQFAGLAGLAVTFGGLVGWGSGYLMLQNVSRDAAALSGSWRSSMRMVQLSGLIFCLLFVLLAHYAINTSTSTFVLVAIGLAELVCTPVVNLASFAFQARERLGWSGAVVMMLSASRLAAVLALGLGGDVVTMSSYVLWHLAASVLCALFAVVSIHLVLKPRSVSVRPAGKDSASGTKYAIAWSTNTATSEIDKTLALHFSGPEASGVYAAAYRVASALTLPVASLVLAAQPRLFRLGSTPDQTAASPLPKIIATCIALGFLASVLLLLVSRTLPALLGPSFEETARLAWMLAALPPLYALRLVGGSVLMTTGHQVARIAVDLSAILLMMTLATIFVTQYGIAAMPGILTATEAWLAVASWGCVWRFSSRIHSSPDRPPHAS